MIPLRVAQDAVTYCAEWMRIAVSTFVSGETNSLMAIKDGASSGIISGNGFKGILDLVVKNADETRSAVPDWALQRIKEAWNVKPD